MVAIVDRKESRIKLRGFASMSREKMLTTARSGGRVRAEQLGHSGYVELGKKGGAVRAMQLGHDGFVAMGRKGGLQRKKAQTKKRARSPAHSQDLSNQS